MIKGVRFTMDSVDRIIGKRGIEKGGAVQKYIDKAVQEHCDPYVPMKTGTLKGSTVGATVCGSGKVVYNTPYARRLYYNPQYKFHGAPQRGGKWFERMKTDHRDAILRGAAKEAGGKAR